MYCEPVCQFKYSTKIFVCNSEPIRDALRRLPYSLTDSKTFNLLARDFWNSQTWFTDTLSGKFFIDRLGFVADDTNSTGNVEIQHALMIDGTFLDVNLFTEVGALVGFGPGENNIVQQLYAQKAIPSPVLLYNSFMSVIKIGDITDNTCGIWSEHDTRDKNRWVLELEKVELNGVRYEKKIKALITNHIKNISLPLNFMNELVGANVLKTFNDIESLIHDSDFYFDCNWPLKLRITVDSRRLTIPNSLLKQSKINDTHCLPYINQIGSLRYSNDVDLILGWPFLKRFCIGFDYGKRIIRLAEHS
ncbi:hypothetical protein M3Y98_00096600 [Aphelenchoides besseyi]|nr:hypothetical protein M3Y98_00096600 [Aphelenchoides besseyi]